MVIGSTDDEDIHVLTTAWERNVLEKIAFLCSLYQKQAQRGRLYLYEPPRYYLAEDIVPSHARPANLAPTGNTRFDRNTMLRVVKGVRKQREKDLGLNELVAGDHVDEPDVWHIHPEYYQHVYNAIIGVFSDAYLVADARGVAMKVVLGALQAYECDQATSWFQHMGRKPILCKWVGMSKGG